MSDFGDDLGLVGSSNIAWNSVEGAPRPTHEPGHAPVSEDVRKLALAWKTRYCEHFNGAYCEICTTQDLADALHEERRKTLEEAIRAAQQTPFRAHSRDDVDFHSGCVQQTERIVTAIRALAAREGAGK